MAYLPAVVQICAARLEGEEGVDGRVPPARVLAGALSSALGADFIGDDVREGESPLRATSPHHTNTDLLRRSYASPSRIL